MNSLPISVVVPHKPTRLSFFAQGCLPMIVRNQPSEILVYPDDRGAAAKRNSGAKIASSEFIFFCDDDVALKGGALQMLVEALRTDAGASFAYSDFDHVVHPGVQFPVASGRRTTGPWDLERLKKEPYISAMCLFRKTAYPGMDDSLQRFDTWDLWLTMAARGGHGAYVQEVLFESHHMDAGVTVSVPADEPLKKIKEKHGLPL